MSAAEAQRGDEDRAEMVRSFCERLWPDIEGFVFVGCGSDPYLTEAGKYSHHQWEESDFSWPRHSDQLVAHVVAESERADVYLTPGLSGNPVRKMDDPNQRYNRRPQPSWFLWSDLDEASSEDLLRLRLLAAAGTFTVASGRGDGHRHAYVALDEPAGPERLYALQRRLRAYLNADPSPSALNGFLRPPGTYNYKPTVLEPGSAPVLVTIDDDSKGGGWSFTQLDDLLPEVVAGSSGTCSAVAAPVPDDHPSWVTELLAEAPVAGKRSDQHWSACVDLMPWYTDGQIVTLIRRHRPTRDKWPRQDKVDTETRRVLGKLDRSIDLVGEQKAEDGAKDEPLNGTRAGGGARKRSVRLTAAAGISPRPTDWLWKDRVPLGALVLLGGREGIGKSICGYTLAADITRGRLPGAYHGQAKSVLVAATEDSWARTIVPRLMAADADLERVYRIDVVVSGGHEAELSLPEDVEALREQIAQVDAALLLLDPLMSRLDARLDTHKDAEVRLALEPLVQMADASAIAVVGLIHVNKSTMTDALSLIMGSRAFTSVSRAVLFAMADPDDETVRLLGQAKNNLGRLDLPTLRYRIEGKTVAETDEGPVVSGRLVWLEETDRTIADLLESAGDSSEVRTLAAEATNWLEDWLNSKGGSADSADVKREAKRAGHGIDGLHRARRKLKIVVTPVGFPRCTYWSLPGAVIAGVNSA